MDAKAESQLVKVIEEMIGESRDMDELPKTREEIVYWLEQGYRHEEAAMIESVGHFRLTNDECEDGVVWIWTGPGLTEKRKLHDFNER